MGEQREFTFTPNVVHYMRGHSVCASVCCKCIIKIKSQEKMPSDVWHRIIGWLIERAPNHLWYERGTGERGTACKYSEQHVRDEDETLTVRNLSLRCNKWSQPTKELMRSVPLEITGA